MVQRCFRTNPCPPESPLTRQLEGQAESLHDFMSIVDQEKPTWPRKQNLKEVSSCEELDVFFRGILHVSLEVRQNYQDKILI